MKKIGAQGLPADRRLTAAANEEFSGGIAAGAVREPEPVKSGWDPYEVWATRVKPARSKRQRQRDPSSQG
jgi:hypothetical protein